MYTSHSASLFDRLSALPEYNADEAKRCLSDTYLAVMAHRAELGERSPSSLGAHLGALRELVTRLEYHGVFSKSVTEEVRTACAFVAAEALDLWRQVHIVQVSAIQDAADKATGSIANMQDDQPAVHRDSVDSSQVAYVYAEIALLYLIAGFDSNAKTVLASLDEPDSPPAPDQPILIIISSIKELLSVGDHLVADLQPTRLIDVGDLRDYVRLHTAKHFSNIIYNFISWLRGGSRDGGAALISSLFDVLSRFTAPPMGLPEEEGTTACIHALHADLHHIGTLIAHSLNELSSRSIRNVPLPTEGEVTIFAEYLLHRIVSRPIIWPSHKAFIDKCLPGPHRHAVATLPTGGGKSYIAELAIAQALCRGWVLYIAPTNALVSQIARDLGDAFYASNHVKITKLLGGPEFTPDVNDEFIAVQKTVYVMTPEKASVLLRREGLTLDGLALCVFDEFHLIGESGGRGALAELVMAKISSSSVETKFLLLSALVENSSDIAKWLEQITGAEAEPINERWRPTRTLRSLVVIDEAELSPKERNARDYMRKKKDQESHTFWAEASLLVNLHGAWKDGASEQYRLLPMGIDIKLKLDRVYRDRRGRKRVSDNPRLKLENKNDILISICRRLAEKGESVLGFVLKSKHSVFRPAHDVGLYLARHLGKPEIPTELIAMLKLCETELGVPSALSKSIALGTASHSRALIDIERAAAERAFDTGVAKVMVATTSLAQGLNLPATAVVLAGVDMGGSPSAPKIPEQRVRSQLLNAIGRAGRAKVAVRGLAVVVPENPVPVAEGRSYIAAANEAEFIKHEDATTVISSQLMSFFSDEFSERILAGETLSHEELASLALLPAGDGGSSTSAILKKTFAAQQFIAAHSRQRMEELAERAGAAMDVLAKRQLGEEGSTAPDCIVQAAYDAGLPVSLTAEMYRSLSNLYNIDVLSGTVTPVEWLDVVVHVVGHLPVELMVPLFSKVVSNSRESEEDQEDVGDLQVKLVKKKPVFRFESLWTERSLSREQHIYNWMAYGELMTSYMRGETYVEMAHAALVSPPDDLGAYEKRSRGDYAIPRTIKVLDWGVEIFTRLAGGILALVAVCMREGILDELPDEAKRALEILPLCVRNGCSDEDTLRWHRLIGGHRVAAHVMNKCFPIESNLVTEKEKRLAVQDVLKRLTQDSDTMAHVSDKRERDIIGALTVALIERDVSARVSTQ